MNLQSYLLRMDHSCLHYNTVNDPMREARRPHSIEILTTMGTSKIVPRGGAPSHGKTTPACGRPLPAGTPTDSARVHVEQAAVKLSLEPRLHSTSRAHLYHSCSRWLRGRLTDPDGCGVFRSPCPNFRKKSRGFDTISIKHLKIFCYLTFRHHASYM